MKTFNITQTISTEQVYNLLISALEGGSNYWYMIKSVQEPKMPYQFTDKLWEGMRAKDPSYINHAEVPFNEGGALLIDDSNADDPELKSTVRLDLERIQNGLSAWATDSQKSDDDKTRTAHPNHWRDFMTGNDDAVTADCFLQYCIFGKVIYG